MAKTLAGKTYAQIVANRCHKVFTRADLPEYNEKDIQVVDVTDNVPNEGDVWDGTSFSPYVPPAKTQAEINADADRMISKHTHAALPTLLEVVTKLAAGVDKATLKVFDDLVKAEKAKKA